MAGWPEKTFRLIKEEEKPSYVYKEVPLPAPVGDELLVKVGKVALCGTDISLYQWNNSELVYFRVLWLNWSTEAWQYTWHHVG